MTPHTDPALIAAGFLEYERGRAKVRQQASLKRGDKNPVVENLPTRDDGRSRDKAGARMGFVQASCVHRNLSTSQRALIAAGFLEYERQQAKVRMAEAGAVGGKGKGKEILPDPFKDTGQSRDKAGAEALR